MEFLPRSHEKITDYPQKQKCEIFRHRIDLSLVDFRVENDSTAQYSMCKGPDKYREGQRIGSATQVMRLATSIKRRNNSTLRHRNHVEAPQWSSCLKTTVSLEMTAYIAAYTEERHISIYSESSRIEGTSSSVLREDFRNTSRAKSVESPMVYVTVASITCVALPKGKMPSINSLSKLSCATNRGEISLRCAS